MFALSNKKSCWLFLERTLLGSIGMNKIKNCVSFLSIWNHLKICHKFKYLPFFNASMYPPFWLLWYKIQFPKEITEMMKRDIVLCVQRQETGYCLYRIFIADVFNRNTTNFCMQYSYRIKRKLFDPFFNIKCTTLPHNTNTHTLVLDIHSFIFSFFLFNNIVGVLTCGTKHT